MHRSFDRSLMIFIVLAVAVLNFGWLAAAVGMVARGGWLTVLVTMGIVWAVNIVLSFAGASLLKREKAA